MNNKYSVVEYKIHIFVSFSDIFPEETVPDINEILSHYSRKSIISAALEINNKYEVEFEKCGSFFCYDNKYQFNDIMSRYRANCAKSYYPNSTYYFASFVTGLELLRRSYSLPIKEADDYDIENFEWQLFRAILIINQQTICRLNAIENIKKYLLVYLNNLCYVDIGKNLKTFTMQQYVYSYMFFKFLLEFNDETRGLLNTFELYYEASWKQYILTLMSAHALSIGNNGRLKKDLEIDKDHLITSSVLDKICMSQLDIYKYGAEDKDDREGNSDYRHFREFPIIDDGTAYVLYSSSMILGKIYNALFFDLRKINKLNPEKKKRINDICQLIQIDFIQDYLFTGLVAKIIPPKYIIHTERAMERRYKKRDGELGPPDLLVQTHKYVILFECKDIRLNGWVKEQKDYSLIINELEKKILGAEKENHKGIGQLTGHLKNIRDGKFCWAKISPGKKVYPVLIISDPNIIQEGFYGIANEKYNESLKNKNVRNIAANKPLIVMSPITLLKYDDYFKRFGFAYFFEDYYLYLRKTRQYEMSFEHFMDGRKSFRKQKLIMEILSEIRQQ